MLRWIVNICLRSNFVNTLWWRHTTDIFNKIGNMLSWIFWQWKIALLVETLKNTNFEQLMWKLIWRQQFFPRVFPTIFVQYGHLKNFMISKVGKNVLPCSPVKLPQVYPSYSFLAKLTPPMKVNELGRFFSGKSPESGKEWTGYLAAVRQPLWPLDHHYS